MLLDCERATLAKLPQHPNIIRVYAEFPASIPPALRDHVTEDMRVAASSDPAHSTQCFVMEFHPMTLDSYRSLFPLPMPWPILWRIARDLVAAVAHLEVHSTVHLDVKMDNVLIAYDGRCVLTDFGIARTFRPEDGMRLLYQEPLELLMNRLVLAPEVLEAHDAAKEAAANRRRATRSPRRTARDASLMSDVAAGASSDRSGADKPTGRAQLTAATSVEAQVEATPTGTAAYSTRSGAGSNRSPRASQSPARTHLPFADQGIWSVGALLYELAAGFGHAPGYPDESGIHYSTAAIPPLPVAPLRSWRRSAAVPQPPAQHGADATLNLHHSSPTVPGGSRRVRSRRSSALVKAASLSHSSHNVGPALSAQTSPKRAVPGAAVGTLGKTVSESSSRGSSPSRAWPAQPQARAQASPGAATASQSQFVRWPKQGFRFNHPGGYPAEFCALVLAMIDADPRRRPRSDAALAALDALEPCVVYHGVRLDKSHDFAHGGASPRRMPGAGATDGMVASAAAAVGTADTTPGVFLTRLPTGRVLPIACTDGCALPAPGNAADDVDSGAAPYLAIADLTDDSVNVQYVPVVLRRMRILPSGAGAREVSEDTRPDVDVASAPSIFSLKSAGEGLHSTVVAARVLCCHSSLTISQVLRCWNLATPLGWSLPVADARTYVDGENGGSPAFPALSPVTPGPLAPTAMSSRGATLNSEAMMTGAAAAGIHAPASPKHGSGRTSVSPVMSLSRVAQSRGSGTAIDALPRVVFSPHPAAPVPAPVEETDELQASTPRRSYRTADGFHGDDGDAIGEDDSWAGCRVFVGGCELMSGARLDAVCHYIRPATTVSGNVLDDPTGFTSSEFPTIRNRGRAALVLDVMDVERETVAASSAYLLRLAAETIAAAEVTAATAPANTVAGSARGPADDSRSAHNAAVIAGDAGALDLLVVSATDALPDIAVRGPEQPVQQPSSHILLQSSDGLTTFALNPPPATFVANPRDVGALGGRPDTAPAAAAVAHRSSTPASASAMTQPQVDTSRSNSPTASASSSSQFLARLGACYYYPPHLHSNPEGRGSGAPDFVSAWEDDFAVGAAAPGQVDVGSTDAAPQRVTSIGLLSAPSMSAETMLQHPLALPIPTVSHGTRSIRDRPSPLTLPPQSVGMPTSSGVAASEVVMSMLASVLLRCSLALTSLANIGLREENEGASGGGDVDFEDGRRPGGFPFVRAAEVAVATIACFVPTDELEKHALPCCASQNHDAVAAALALLRNLSCTQSSVVASALVRSGAVRAALRGFLGDWVVGVRVAAAPSTAPSPTEGSVRKQRVHGNDMRVAEDALLAAANLLRFDEQQTTQQPWMDAAAALRVIVDQVALAAAGNSTPTVPLPVADAAMRLLRYSSAIEGVDVALALARAGALLFTSKAVAWWPSERTLLEMALHTTCALLVHAPVRLTSLVPVFDMATAVVAVMSRAELVDDVGIQGLGATVLRNLACVVDSSVVVAGTDDSLPFPAVAAASSPSQGANVSHAVPAALSGTLLDSTIPLRAAPYPALIVTKAGAPAVLEAALERHNSVPSVAENARCALYNLLLIGATEADMLIARNDRLKKRLDGAMAETVLSRGAANMSGHAVLLHQQQQQVVRGNMRGSTPPLTLIASASQQEVSAAIVSQPQSPPRQVPSSPLRAGAAAFFVETNAGGSVASQSTHDVGPSSGSLSAHEVNLLVGSSSNAAEPAAPSAQKDGAIPLSPQRSVRARAPAVDGPPTAAAASLWHALGFSSSRIAAAVTRRPSADTPPRTPQLPQRVSHLTAEAAERAPLPVTHENPSVWLLVADAPPPAPDPADSDASPRALHAIDDGATSEGLLQNAVVSTGNGRNSSRSRDDALISDVGGGDEEAAAVAMQTMSLPVPQQALEDGSQPSSDSWQQRHARAVIVVLLVIVAGLVASTAVGFSLPR